MNDMTQEFEEQPQAPRTGPGRRLREAREARGMSLEEAAMRLRLHERLVRALEADDNDHLPPPAFVIGYLRNYARVLDISQDEVLASYSGRLPETTTPRLVSRMRAEREVRSSDLLVRLVTWLIVLGLIALVGWSLVQYGGRLPGMSLKDEPKSSGGTPSTLGKPLYSLPGEQPMPLAPPPPPVEESHAAAPQVPATPPPAPQQTAPQQTAQAAPSPSQAPPAASKPGAPATPPAAATPPSAGAPAAGKPAQGGNAPTAANQAPAAAAAAPATPPPAAEHAKPAEGSAPTAANEIRLEFTSDSWARVTDATGKRLLGDLIRSGKSFNLKGQPPFEVTLGYAPGVVVQYQGETIDHSKYNRKNIAKFNVGKGGEKPADAEKPAAEKPAAATPPPGPLDKIE